MNKDIVCDGKGFSVCEPEPKIEQKIAAQKPDQKEGGRVCVCGKTESCFRPRCDFPGWHGA